MVAAFQSIPTLQDIVSALQATLPNMEYDPAVLEEVLEIHGVGKMLDVAPVQFEEMKNEGKWPSMHATSNDGEMIFSFQWIHG